MGAVFFNVNYWKNDFVSALNQDVKEANDNRKKKAMDAITAMCLDRAPGKNIFFLMHEIDYYLKIFPFSLPNDEKEIKIQFRKALADRLVQETDLEIVFRKNVIEGVQNGGYIDIEEREDRALPFSSEYIQLLQEQYRFCAKVKNFSPEKIEAAIQGLPESLRDSFSSAINMPDRLYEQEKKLKIGGFRVADFRPVPPDLIDRCLQVKCIEEWVTDLFMSAVFANEMKRYVQMRGNPQKIVEKINAVGLAGIYRHLQKNIVQLQKIKDQIVRLTGQCKIRGKIPKSKYLCNF